MSKVGRKIKFDETDYQKEIARHLVFENKFVERENSDFDCNTAIDKGMLYEFLKKSQPDNIDFIESRIKTDVKDFIMNSVNEEILKNEDGLIGTLKKGVNINGVHFDLRYAKPDSKRSKRRIDEYNSNIISVAREVYADKARTQRIDLVIFLNGIAIFAIEAKYNSSGRAVRDAIDQYKETRDPNARLLMPKYGVLVCFAMDTEEVWMTTKLDRENTEFLPFNKGCGEGIEMGAGNPEDPSGDRRVSYMWKEIFTKEFIIDVISNDIYIDKGSVVFPRYHQQDCNTNLLEDVYINGTKYNYTIQHSAGSGKTNTISWFVHRLISFHNEHDEIIYNKIIVISDEISLDRHLQENIRKIGCPGGVIAYVSDGYTSKYLAEKLNDEKTRVIVTTIQKFHYILEEIRRMDDKRFAVIIDEAHKGMNGKNMDALTSALSCDGEDSNDLEEIIAAEIKGHGKPENVSMFAFTATPTQLTLEVFGTIKDGKKVPFHIYSMKQAIEEGFILDVTSSIVIVDTYCKINKTISTDPSCDEKTATREITEKVELDEEVVRQRAEFIVEDHKTNIKPQLDGCGKSMVVAPFGRKDAAYAYYKAIKKYVEDKRKIDTSYDGINVLIAFSGTVKDSTGEYTERDLNGFKEERLPAEFDKNEYDILVVAGKYQTGFDQPKLCGLYDLCGGKGVHTVQKDSRLNRPYYGYDKKPRIVAFANTYEEIRDSFAPYFTMTTTPVTITKSELYRLDKKIGDYELWNDSLVDELVKNSYILDSDDEISIGKKERRSEQIIQNVLSLIEKKFEEENDRKEFFVYLKTFVNYYEILSKTIVLEDNRLYKNYMFIDKIVSYKPAKIKSTSSVKEAISVSDVSHEATEVETNPLMSKPTLSPSSVSSAGSTTSGSMTPLSEIIAKYNDSKGRPKKPSSAEKLVRLIVNELKVDRSLMSYAKHNDEDEFVRVCYYPAVISALIKYRDKSKKFCDNLITNKNAREEVFNRFTTEVYEALKNDGKE